MKLKREELGHKAYKILLVSDKSFSRLIILFLPVAILKK
ncbi:hypothetical protein PORCAN_499 [Porphyromonas crevioricanis JCM 13913]|nr:hypothetical protein PORCAN_499 [Porphyromonas crevioricanis JCM 13913]